MCFEKGFPKFTIGISGSQLDDFFKVVLGEGGLRGRKKRSERGGGSERKGKGKGRGEGEGREP